MNQNDSLWLTPREYEKQNKSSLDLEERIKELEEKSIALLSVIRISERAMDIFLNSPYTGTDDEILIEIDNAWRECRTALYAERYRK